MPFTLNPAIAELLALGAGPAQPEDFHEGDHRRLRAILDDGLAQMSALPVDPAVTVIDVVVTTPDGHTLGLKWYSRAGERPGSAVVHFHGGARIAGSVALYDPLVRTYVAWTGVPMLAVDYRLAPEAAADAPALDGLTALRWLRDNAGTLGVDVERIAVMGDSAGGGIAASVAIVARDAGIPLARQILIYPMLDDRVSAVDPQLAAVPTLFSYVYSRTAWATVLNNGESHNFAIETPPTIAAGRNRDFTGLAPALIEVGELDIFRNENIAYAQGLWRAGVSTDLRVHPGMPHAFDVLLLGESVHQEGKLRAIAAL